MLFTTKNASINISFSRLVRRSISVSYRNAADMADKDGELRVFVVSGEVSGDAIASRLMASLKMLCPFPIQFSGVGGSMMSQQGLKSLFPVEDIAVMGMWELLPHLNKIRVKLKETIDAALLFRPHVVLTVDSKGFCFRFLRKLRDRCSRQGLVSPLHFHYVAPSFWAWKGGEARLRGLSEIVDHLFCILPFEVEVCKSRGLDATFVGHPTLEDIWELTLGNDIPPNEWKVQGEGFQRLYKASSGATVISLLPGSRLQEVTRMVSIFSDTLKLLSESFPNLETIIHVAPNQHVENYIKQVLPSWPVPAILVPGGSLHVKYEAFSASRVALSTSGTAAVELQLARLPCVVAYRAHFLTECLIRYKAKIPYISLPNILLNSPVIPEALFGNCTPSRLASLLMELIHNDGLRNKQIVAAGKLINILSPSKSSIGDWAQQDLRWKFSRNPTPSMIAASTILHYVKK